MNLQVSGGSFQGLAMLAMFAGLCWSVFWMVVGWRAMRAHERIAENLETVTRKFREPTA